MAEFGVNRTSCFFAGCVLAGALLVPMSAGAAERVVLCEDFVATW